MNTYTYHKDIRTILAAVGNVFGGMTIVRMVGDVESPNIDKITVPVLYSPKTRTLHELVNTSKHIKLPIMCYELKSVQYDAGRNFNKINGYLAPNKVDWTNTSHPMPLPVKMSISASFICRFQEDYHQYITCLFTYFAPYVEISYRHPDLDVEVRCRVIWDGNSNIVYPEQLNGTDSQRYEIDTTFTVESWLYKNDYKKVNIIYNIPITFGAFADLGGTQKYLTDKIDNGEVGYDYRVFEGRPIAWYTSTTVVDVGKNDVEVLIKGSNFLMVKEVAVTDMDPTEHMFNSEKYKEYKLRYYSYDDRRERPDGKWACEFCNEVFDTKRDLEKHMVEVDANKDEDEKTHKKEYVFDGVPAKFEIIDDHRIIVKIPKAEKDGRFDICLMGKCGYGRLSQDSYRAYLTKQMSITEGIEGQKISDEDETENNGD